MKKRMLFVTAMAILVGSSPAANAAPERLNMGSTSSSSSYYSGSVAMAKIINSNVPSVRITVVESGATYDNIKRTPNEFQLSMPSSYSGLVEAYQGIGAKFSGDEPRKSLRMMFGFVQSSIMYVVAADAGVNNFKDLIGKKFYAGPTGNQTVAMTKQIMSLYDGEPEWYVGGFADAITAYQNGRVVGFAKSGAGIQLDASMIQANTTRPIKLLRMTEQDLNAVVNNFPGMYPLKIDKGAIKSLPEAEGSVPGLLIVAWTTSDLPTDLVYSMTKAMVENWDTFGSAFPQSKSFNPVDDTISGTSKVANPVPLHAGVVKYFRELGKTIPDNIVPPEAK